MAPLGFEFPLEAIAAIFRALDFKSVSRSSCVCKQWLDVARNDDRLWSRKFVDDFRMETCQSSKAGHYTREDYAREWAFRFGEIRITSISPAHGFNYFYWTFVGSLAIGGSVGGRIHVVDLKSRRHLQTINVGEEIRSIACNGRTIVVGSSNGFIGCWELKSGAFILSCSGHAAVVECLDCDAKIIASGSSDALITLWDMESGHCIEKLIGHNSTVNCVQIFAGRIVSGGSDKCVKIWDMETGQCLRTLLHCGSVSCLKINGRHILSGGCGIRVFDGSAYTPIRKIGGCGRQVTSLYADDAKVVSGSLDGMVRIWDWKTGECVREMNMGGLRYIGDSIKLFYCDCECIYLPYRDGSIRVCQFTLPS